MRLLAALAIFGLCQSVMANQFGPLSLTFQVKESHSMKQVGQKLVSERGQIEWKVLGSETNNSGKSTNSGAIELAWLEKGLFQVKAQRELEVEGIVEGKVRKKHGRIHNIDIPAAEMERVYAPSMLESTFSFLSESGIDPEIYRLSSQIAASALKCRTKDKVLICLQEFTLKVQGEPHN